MSLVNDMLRDLDQRRKDSDGPAARVRLTPAGDYKKREQRNPVPVIAIGLLLAAAVLASIWLQMNSGSAARDVSATVATNSPAIEIEEAIAATPGVAVTTDSAQAQVDPELVASTTLDELLEQASVSEPAISPAPTVNANATAAQSNRVSNSVASNSVQERASASAANPSVVNGHSNSSSRVSAPQANTQNLTARAAEPIKDEVEPSQRLKDTMVVQQALQLIANNNPVAAYTTLEKFILDNPYADQSRETYAKLLLNQGDLASANQLVDAGLQLSPNHNGFKKVKARLLIDVGDIDSAVSLLQNRAPTVQDDSEYHEILASAQLALRDYAGAASSYTSLIQKDQSQGRWWYGFAAAQDALGNDKAARQAYARAMEQTNLSASLRRRSQIRLAALNR